jgi:hypothetical protein
MLELAVTKRKAKYAGETGLFGADQTADEEIARLTNDEMAWAEITTPRNIKLLRYLWAIATHLASGGLFEDKNEAMDDLKIRARFARFAVEKGRTVIVPRSLSKQRGDVLSRLAERFVFIVCRDLLPHMKESEFKNEIEKMVAQ